MSVSSSRARRGVIGLLGGIVVFFTLELIINYYNYWWLSALCMLLVLSVLLNIQTKKYYRFREPFIVALLFMVLGTGVLFFIETRFIQHIYSFLLALLVTHFLFFIGHKPDELQHRRVHVQSVIFFLAYIFLLTIVINGLHTFFTLPVFISFGIFTLCIVFFPHYIVLKNHDVSTLNDIPTAPLIPNTSSPYRLYLWITALPALLPSSATSQDFFSGNAMHHTHQSLLVMRTKIIILFLISELFVVASFLPVTMYVTAITITLLSFAIIILFHINQLGLLRSSLTFRTIFITVLLCVIILISAQWA